MNFDNRSARSVVVFECKRVKKTDKIYSPKKSTLRLHYIILQNKQFFRVSFTFRFIISFVCSVWLVKYRFSLSESFIIINVFLIISFVGNFSNVSTSVASAPSLFYGCSNKSEESGLFVVTTLIQKFRHRKIGLDGGTHYKFADSKQ